MGSWLSAPKRASARTLTLCPYKHSMAMLELITSGSARGEKGVAALPRRADRERTTVITGGPAAAATDYSRSSGRRSQTHPLATASQPSRSVPLARHFRHNKGFQATAHKLPLCNRFPSLQSYIVMPVGRRLNPDVGHKTIK